MEHNKIEISLSPDVCAFLVEVLKPIKVSHDSPLCDFIKNQVLKEVFDKINTTMARGYY